MRLALIPPIAMLRSTLLTDMQMMLAPMVMQSHHYLEMYMELHRAAAPYCCSHIILDNGAAEGNAATFSQVMNMVNDLRPTEVVLPDVMGDAEATKVAILEAVEAIKTRPVSTHRVKYMAVLQGDTATECISLFHELKDVREIMTWGLPRHLLRSGGIATRAELARYISTHDWRDIHCLGASTAYPSEVSLLADAPVRSIDTSLPFVYTMHGIDLADNTKWRPVQRPNEYFRCGIDTLLAVKNIGTYMRWAYES